MVGMVQRNSAGQRGGGDESQLAVTLTESSTGFLSCKGIPAARRIIAPVEWGPSSKLTAFEEEIPLYLDLEAP